jgi:GAF domain-containing protein/anti-sigma regulatory factor (Ser/Thr protein kinase)
LFSGIARSSVSVPIVGEQGVLGVIALMFSDERTAGDDDLRIVTSLAEQASVALERALAFERERATADRLTRLQEVTAALSAATDPQQVGEAALSVGLPALGAAAGALYTMSDDGAELRLVADEGYPDELMRDFDVIRMDADVAIADAVRSKKVIFFGSEDEAEARSRTIAERRRAGPITTKNGPRAAMPLLAGVEAIGALAISFPGHHAADEQDRRSLETIATLVAQALERARLHATEHRVAMVLQESLLPQALRSVGPARVAARYLAAATEASVGGDWFEIVDLPDECIGIAVGDVVGSGILAATAMGQLRSALRALALAGKKPGEILGSLDDFAGTTEGAVMSTAAYAEFDTRSGTLCYVSAGHPPPLVVGPAEPRFLEDGRRTPLGVTPPSPPPPEGAKDSLGSGETIILYTDGLVERRDEALDVGLARLAEAADRFSDRGPDMLAEHLVQSLLPDGSVGDDAAVLCLRFEPATWIEPGGDAPSRFDHRFSARAEELAKLRASMRGWLGSAGIGSGDAEQIVLAVGEACANAIEHGNGGASGEINVSLELDDEHSLTATVTDSGAWRNGGPSGRGYGLLLMRALMDEVIIEPGDRGSMVTLRKTVDRDGSHRQDDPTATSG